MNYSEDFFKRFEEKLDHLAAKGSPKSAHGIKSRFAQIWPRIEKCIQKGFTYQELFEEASELGLKCSFSSFKSYLSTARGKRKNKKAKPEKTTAKKVAKKMVAVSAAAPSKPSGSTNVGQKNTVAPARSKPELNQQDELFN